MALKVKNDERQWQQTVLCRAQTEVDGAGESR